MKILPRLLLSYLLITAFTVTVGAISIIEMHTINSNFNQIVTENILVLKSLRELQVAGLSIITQTSKTPLLLQNLKQANLAKAQYQAQVQHLKEEMETKTKAYFLKLKQYKKLIDQYFPDEKQYSDKISKDGEQLLLMNEKFFTLATEGKSKELVLATEEELQSAQDVFFTSIEQALTHEQKKLNAQQEKTEGVILFSRIFISLFTIIAFLITLVATWLIARHLWRFYRNIVFHRGNIDR